jgi:sugar O-acyltransferase (sialic acid O-acetyltransferase NeuD family)
MPTNKLLIFGTGTLGEIANYYFSNDSDYEVQGFIDRDDVVLEAQAFLGKQVYNWSQTKEKFTPEEISVFVAIGYRKTNQIRQERYEMITNDGYTCASYISSKVVNMAINIGENCFILENNVLQPFVKIGNNVTLWSGNHIGHHSSIDDNAFITSHVVISGKCNIGKNSFIGVNSCLRDGITIGEYSVIGSGSIVMADCEPRSVFSAKPTDSRIIKRNVV